MNASPVYEIKANWQNQQYNDCQSLIKFLNEHREIYSSAKTKGSIIVADDQFVNQ